MSDLLSVSGALERILDGASPVGTENVELAEAGGRVLADDIRALRTQPPFSASAMDGYAIKAADVTATPVKLTMIGESAAGHGFDGSIRAGQCVRIFTGAPVPDGADTVVIQENVEADGRNIRVLQGEVRGRYVRPAGLDFKVGETLLREKTVLDAGSISLAAAANHAELPVYSDPKVGLIASGDELVLPGRDPASDQIVASNSYGVAHLVRRAGGVVVDTGIAADSIDSLTEKLDRTDQCDIVITLGGASVGDHDLVREALERREVDLSFWSLAMRPGKPVMFGKKQDEKRSVRYLGLPGNPVSSLVCTTIFVVPLIRALLGLDPKTETKKGTLGRDLPPNDQREEYMRATVEYQNGDRIVTPFTNQDSSMLSLYQRADCLLVRPAFAVAAVQGSVCEIVPLR